MRLSLSRLVSIITVCLSIGIASMIAIQMHTLGKLEIGSETYTRIIDGKDLIADILPPPLFVTEAYMLSLESAAFPDKRTANQEKLKALRGEFLTRETYWKDRPLSAPERIQLEEKVIPAGKTFWALADAIGDRKADPAALEALSLAFHAHRDEVVKLVDIANATLQRAEEEARSGAALWNAVSLAAAAFGLVVALLAGFAMHYRAIRPVVTLTALMRRMADGDFGMQAPFATRTDEIGQMARALDIFRKAGIEQAALQGQAEAMRIQAEADRLEATRHAEAEAAERLRLATSGLGQGLHRLASGDLSIRLDEAFSIEFETLRQDFNDSVRQLHDALQEISTSVSTLDHEASDIARSAGEIGQRTGMQAASLEETAASLDEISANVRNSTRLTEEARDVASRASDSAAQSVGVVEEAEVAMQRIEASSQKIGGIISVIDEIAFQTNLLALNAGVEAARAGEAGKGFAVVAQEVRELAQRSAGAAREIKELVSRSSAEVEGGVKLVRQTGDALKEIVGFIADINRHMEAISISAREQASGISSINGSVTQMDQATQQNAAMVSEQNHSAERLATEASRLARLMARFTLSVDALSGRPLGRRAA